MIESDTIVVRPDGLVVLPDLTGPLAQTATALGASAPERQPGTLGGPRLAAARRIRLPLPDPATLDEAALWQAHREGARRWRARVAGDAGAAPPAGGVGWLAVKQALARRLLGPAEGAAGGCRLCARGCRVDRRRGERGFCGLGTGLRFTAPVRLWGEEPELGRPGLGLLAAGCGLRCRFCYRPQNLPAGAGEGLSPGAVAGWIEAADDVEHVHFVGGNPDESLPAILDVLAAVTVPRPVVWNTHSYLTGAQVALLEGVVDGFVADLKFGPGACGEQVAGTPGYWPAATAVLRQMAGFDSRLIVRHVALPGHFDCCTRPVARWLKTALPQATVYLLEQYEPLHRAVGDAVLGRRLSETERAELAALAAWLDNKDGEHGQADSPPGDAVGGL